VKFLREIQKSWDGQGEYRELQAMLDKCLPKNDIRIRNPKCRIPKQIRKSEVRMTTAEIFSVWHREFFGFWEFGLPSISAFGFRILDQPQAEDLHLRHSRRARFAMRWVKIRNPNAEIRGARIPKPEKNSRCQTGKIFLPESFGLLISDLFGFRFRISDFRSSFLEAFYPHRLQFAMIHLARSSFDFAEEFHFARTAQVGQTLGFDRRANFVELSSRLIATAMSASPLCFIGPADHAT